MQSGRHVRLDHLSRLVPAPTIQEMGRAHVARLPLGQVQHRGRRRGKFFHCASISSLNGFRSGTVSRQAANTAACCAGVRCAAGVCMARMAA